MRFCLNLPPRSHIDPFPFRKINWLPVEYCIMNTVLNYWNWIVLGYIHEMFMPSLCRYSTRSQMALDIPLRKTNTALLAKVLEHCFPLCLLLRKIFCFICETNSSYYRIHMTDIIIWFSRSNIISSCHYWYPFKSFVIF